MKELISEHIKLYFSIDECSGSITRTDRKNSLGSYDKDGYLIFKVKKNQIKSHRLAWFLYYGEFPCGEIDHINRIKTDNSKANLRIATRKENVNNSYHKPTETGFYGVYIDRTNGLKKKYACKAYGKTFRFYSLNDAINFKQNETISRNSE